ncbi:MAG: VCBS repeat-containing protein [Nitrospina sp.]|nr:VCBS repeat-containing protein [Nitrospina sp.]MBT3855460.1 VCBS repeat-containing protein [Nitrospina sp.]MBT4103663.1 VCBS repeat-containing protein [Nitrospina sp.]MBT4388424.1 VCBS repeat-containing protein [Nitrospina sp.]MBT4621398.1 VCBS repeat-containing protein [Nitrospina sp.]
MKFLRNPLFKIFLIALFLVVPGNALAQSSASLDRLVSQIESMFPPLEGYVIAVEGSGLTLDLRQGMAVKKGDRLKLIRYGRELFHPVTKKKVGQKETDLGEVEVLEVRKDYSLARALNPTVLPKEGDGVRSAFQKLSFLVAPPQVKSKKKINTDRLRYNLESRINRHPRFEVPAFDLGLWMVDEKLNIKSTLQSKNLKKLLRKVQADFILVPSVRTVKGKMALNYKLVSAIDGSLKKQANILSEDLPAPDAPRERESGTQTSFKQKKDLFKFVGKQEFPYEVIDFDVGDLNGDGKNEFVLIDRYRVMIFENKKGRLKRISMVKTSKIANHFLAVDVGDINGNGRDEIFVTNQVGDKLQSFALETRPKEKGFHYIWKEANLYFRIIQPLGKRPILMSQSPGFQNPFQGPIKKVFFKNGIYRQGPKLNTPEVYGTHFILYGLTQQDLNGNGVTETIVLDNNYHLRVYSPDGRLVVKSSDYYGHDPRLIEVGVKEEIAGIVRQGDPVRFKGRLQFVKVGGSRFLLLPLNHNAGDGYLDRLVIVENSGLALLRLTGEGFEKAFESSKQKGFLGTYRVIPHKNGAGVYVLRIDKDVWAKGVSSTLSTYEWPAE